ncbi:hypothetical protein LZ32DRAFT_658750 [Colletotrichum eremochloae]|nr:hypothetical protein LZ32DRAFT_658750 [Colletotrichum eremochloae]
MAGISGISNETITRPSEASKRIFWTLNGPLESAIQVAPKPYYELGDTMEPYFRPGPASSWHPVSQEYLMEPQVTSITARVQCLDDWEDLWVELNRKCHDTKNHPLRPRAKHIQLKVTTSGEFLTIHEYVSAVHPWLMGMREKILYALGKIDGRGVPWPSETKLAVLDSGGGPMSIGKEEEWACCHREIKPFVHKSWAERDESSRKAQERYKAISAARVRELERRRQGGNN